MKEEFLEIFDLSGEYLGIEDRKKYYKKIEEIPTQVKRVTALILTPDGNIILQKRSYDKDVNSGMYDKSVGGHTMVTEGYKDLGKINEELSDINMSKELLEELNIPANIISNNLFVDVLNFQTDRMAFITKIETIFNYPSERVKSNGDKFIQHYITENYIGYYNGTIQFKDGEAVGLEYISRERLVDNMKKRPEDFTEDLKFLINKYYEYLIPLKEFKKKFNEDGNNFNI